MRQDGKDYISGKRLKTEIKRAGFSINDKKTRIQYKDSRQDVTGLVVNKKPNVKNEYWRKARSQCHSLFRTGSFTKKLADKIVAGNINELEGQLNFIDQVDRYNRLRQKPPLNPVYAHKRELQKHLKHTKHLLSGREKTFSRFLYYRSFYGNAKPTILCEGKTDNVYLKAAISELVNSYPKLATPKLANPNGKDKNYELLLRFVEYTKRTKFLLELSGGGDHFKGFLENLEEEYKFYKAPKSQHPVIIVLDNDTGPKDLLNYVKFKSTAKLFPALLDIKNDLRKAEYIHVFHNVYIVLTPLSSSNEHTDIEYFFDNATRSIMHKGKCFNTVKKRNVKVDLSKDSFANHVVKGHKKAINFDGLKPLLDRVVQAIEHYDSIK